MTTAIILTAIASSFVTIAVVKPEFLFYIINPGALVYLAWIDLKNYFFPDLRYRGPSNEGSLIDLWVKSIAITIAMWTILILWYFHV